MCLYPKLIKNRKYTKNKKNGGNIPPLLDKRAEYVPIGCQRCIECKKQKAREWQIRLLEEVRHNANGKFITLTFSNESITKLINQCELQDIQGYQLDNSIATHAIRYFVERWRKKYKTSIRHWLVTELGHNGTENIHLHGILWTTETYATIQSIWQYGFIWPTPQTTKKTYVNQQTVNYVIKYVNKIDQDHPNYNSIILTSPGIGSSYTKSLQFKEHKFNGLNTKETYRTSTGHQMSLPIYYRNKAYTDEQKEKLWLQRLDKNERWVCGEKIQADNIKEYFKLLKWYRRINKQLGYGNDEKDWNQEQYENQKRQLLYEKRRNQTTNNTSNTNSNKRNNNNNNT